MDNVDRDLARLTEAVRRAYRYDGDPPARQARADVADHLGYIMAAVLDATADDDEVREVLAGFAATAAGDSRYIVGRGAALAVAAVPAGATVAVADIPRGCECLWWSPADGGPWALRQVTDGCRVHPTP